jgi:hypothetical protein
MESGSNFLPILFSHRSKLREYHYKNESPAIDFLRKIIVLGYNAFEEDNNKTGNTWHELPSQILKRSFCLR